MKPRLLFPILFTTLLSAACVSPPGATPRLDLLGSAAPVSAAARTIVIKPDTRYVNVTGGETIRFVAGEKSFAWHFDGALQVTSFALNQVAPSGLLEHKVTVYIAPNPLYTGGDGDRAGDGSHK